MRLDLTMNFRIFGLNRALGRTRIPGVVETVPAVRSILIHYDGRTLAPATPGRRAHRPRARGAGGRRPGHSEPAGDAAHRVRGSLDAWRHRAIRQVRAQGRAQRDRRAQRRVHRALQRPRRRRAGDRDDLRHRVVERQHRLLARPAVHVPARPAPRHRRAQVQPHPAVDGGGRGRDRRPVRGDLPGDVAGRVSALRPHGADLRPRRRATRPSGRIPSCSGPATA